MLYNDLLMLVVSPLLPLMSPCQTAAPLRIELGATPMPGSHCCIACLTLVTQVDMVLYVVFFFMFYNRLEMVYRYFNIIYIYILLIWNRWTIQFDNLLVLCCCFVVLNILIYIYI